MKKFIIPVLLLATVMTTSCGSDAVEATDAKEVKEVAVTGTYSQLGDHNHVDWKAWHAGKTGERFGKVLLKNAEASVNEGELVGGKFVIDMKSLSVENFTGADTVKNEKLKGHLSNEDFFLVDSFPTATFEITNVDTTSGDYNSVVTGNLTIKDVSKSISFKSNVDISENGVTIASETFEIDRTNWNLTYKAAGIAGILANEVLDNEIAFTIHASVTK